MGNFPGLSEHLQETASELNLKATGNLIASDKIGSLALRENCLNTKFFAVRIFPYSGRIRRFMESEYGNIRTRKNSAFGHFSHSVDLAIRTVGFLMFLDGIERNQSY